MTAALTVLGAAMWWSASAADSVEYVGGRVASSDRPATELLPPRMRGRASLLTLMFANVVERAARAAGVEAAALPSVYASAYGEMTTLLALLSQLEAGSPLSPAKFQASVHNTASGQLSIAQRNRGFSTSIAAGDASVPMALLEAGCYLARHPGTLILACGDESSTPLLDPAARFRALAVGLVVSSNAVGRGALGRIGLPELASEPEAEPLREAAARTRNPCEPAGWLVEALLGERASRLRVPCANGECWTIEVEPVGPR